MSSDEDAIRVVGRIGSHMPRAIVEAQRGDSVLDDLSSGYGEPRLSPSRAPRYESSPPVPFRQGNATVNQAVALRQLRSQEPPERGRPGPGIGGPP